MRTLSVLLLAVAACGRTSGIVPEPLPAPNPVTIPTPTTTTTQPLVGCTGKSVIALVGATLTRLGADGSSTALFHFGAGLPDEDVVITNGWEERNGFIGLWAFLDDETGGTGIRYEYLVLDASGSVVFHKIQTEPYNPTTHLGADGSLAVAGGRGWVVRGGTLTDLGALMPMTAVLPDGTLPVAHGQPWDGTTAKGLLTLSTMAEVPLAPGPDSNSAYFEVGGKLLYVTSDNRMVLTNGSGTQTVQLPATQSPWFPAQFAGDRFVLFGSSGQFAAADTTALTVHLIAGAPDPAQRYGTWAVSLSDDGTAFAGFLENGLLQQRSSTDFGATWTPRGNPMTPGMDFGLGQWLYAIAHGDGVLTLDLSTGYGDYLHAVQLVGPSSAMKMSTGGLYVNESISPGAADLSADGQCAAFWSPTGADAGPRLQLSFVDGTNGAKAVLSADQMAMFRF
jgi:hypothetical protein